MSKTKTPKHVIWFMADQLRADCLGFMGNSIVRTPNLDRLANNGVIADKMFVQYAACMPSRASMLTGRYPSTIRMSNGSPFLDPREVTLPEILQREGWRTGMFGKLHITPQVYTLDNLKTDRPITDAKRFIKESCLPEIPDDPVKNDYGFQEVAGVEDSLWGEYIDWLKEKDPELAEKVYPESGSPMGMLKHIEKDFPDVIGDVGESCIHSSLHPSAFIAESAADFFTRNSDDSCFMQVSFIDPHHPWDPPYDLAKNYDPKDMPLPKYNEAGNVPWPQSLLDKGGPEMFKNVTPEMTQTIIAYYYAMIECFDLAVGRVVEAVEKSGQLDDTLFLFCCDHGEHLGSYGLFRKGCLHYDHLIQTPFFASWNNGFSGGRRIDGLLQALDIAPTILELTGKERHPGMQGIDFSPALHGTEDVRRPWIYCQEAWCPSGPYVNQLTIRTETAKLNYFPDDHVGQLFDLVKDPDEINDVSSDPNYNETYREMMGFLTESLYDQKDPLPIRLSQY